MKKVFIPAIFLLTAVVFMAGCGKKPDAVAKVGSQEITLTELKSTLSQRFNTSDYATISMEDKQKVLESMIDNLLIAQRARELKLDEKPEFTQDVDSKVDNLMAQKLYEIKIVDKFLPDDLIRKMLSLNDYDFKLDVIALGYKTSKDIRNDRSKEEAIKLGDEIVEKIRKGEDAQALSKQYTDENGLKRKNGLLEGYSPGLFDPEFDMQLYKAGPGSIIGPVVSDRGIYIAKVIEKKKKSTIQPSNYAQESLRLKRQLFQKFYMDQGNKEYQSLTEEFKKNLGSEISDEGITKFLEAVKQWASVPNPKDDQFTEEDRAILLGKIGDTDITAGYFIDQFRGRFSKFYQRYNNQESMKKIMENQINYMAWIKTAKEEGINKIPEVKAEIQRQENAKLVEMFNKYEINEKIDVPEEAIQQYYDEHKDQYREAAKIRIWEIAVKDESQANHVYDLAKRRNADFTKLAEKYTEKQAMKKRGGDLGYQSESSGVGDISKKAFQAGPNQLLKPFKSGNLFYVLKTGALQPEKIKPLDEMRSRIVSEITRTKEKDAHDSMVEEIKKNSTYWINEPLLRQMS